MRHRNYHGCIDSVFWKKYSEVSKWNDRNLVRDYFSFSHFYINNKDDIDKLWILSLLVEKIDTEFWEKYSDAKSEIPIAESLVEEPEPAISLTELFRNTALEIDLSNEELGTMVGDLRDNMIDFINGNRTEMPALKASVNKIKEQVAEIHQFVKANDQAQRGYDIPNTNTRPSVKRKVESREDSATLQESERPAQSRMVGLKTTFTEEDVKFGDVRKFYFFKSSHDIYVTKSELNHSISRFQNVLWFNLMTNIEVSSKFAYKNIDRVFDIFNIPGSDTYQYMRTELQASDCRKCLHRYTQDSPYLSHGTILEKLPTPFIDAMDKYIILN